MSAAIIPIHRGDQLGLHALEVAHDFWAIASTLPQTRVADVRKDLDVAVGGKLELPASDRRELQFQSQFVVRASFVMAGIETSHPTKGPRHGKKPDMLVDDGAQLLGVEVKRPLQFKNVLPRFIDGATQLIDYGVHGAIFIDMTDCVRGRSTTEIQDAVDSATQSIYDEMRLTSGELKFPNVITAGAFARIPLVADEGEKSAMLERFVTHRIGVVVELEGSALDDSAKWIRTAFSDGVLEVELSARNEL